MTQNRLLLGLLCGLFLVFRAGAQEPEDGDDYIILQTPDEGIDIMGAAKEREHASNIVTREDMEREGAADLWEAVRNVPGVVITGGGQRNDSNFTVRGYGPDAVPIFVDGVPIANTYRGDGDGARLLTGDLEEIEINKGYSSSLLGANTLGGAIQLRTARPQKTFEAAVKASLDFDGGGYAGNTELASAGTRLDRFYGKAVFQYRNTSHYRLSDSFTPLDSAPPEQGGNPQKKGNRVWSDSLDYKLTLLAGITPMPELDISAAYIIQIADKGVSPPAVLAGRDGYVIWDWPRWDRHSVSLNYAFDAEKLYVSGWTNFSKYDNRLDQYYNYRAWMRGVHLPSSDYDEYAIASRLEAGYSFTANHRLAGAVMYKQDDHRGLDAGIETNHINEDTWSAGVEYSGRFRQKFRASAGIGFDSLVPREFSSRLNDEMIALGSDWYLVRTRQKFLLSAQAGIFYNITDNRELRLTYARKNRFPTMFQRYSTRFGETLPNPRLGSEFADHFEAGYRATTAGGLQLNAAVYYSEISGKIARIRIANPVSPDVSVEYYVNLDKTATYGAELGFTYYPPGNFILGGAFALNRYKVLDSAIGAEKITYYPEGTFSLYAELFPLKNLALIPSVAYTGPRYTNIEGTKTLGSYTLFSIKVKYDFLTRFSASFSIENIFDELYEIREYFPMPGRSFNLTLAARY
jgi:iron complex outermembrane receptor protein